MLAGFTLLFAAVSGLLTLPLASDFLLDRLMSWEWVLARSLPPAAFAAAFILPGIAMTWREQQKLRQKLALAEQRSAVAELSKQVTLAQLKSLQAQVEPHFLYNTLAGVQYLVRHNPPLADAMLEHLITYLRRAMPSMRAQASTVQAECELVQAYLEIMKLRMGSRLQISVQYAPETATLPVPPLMLATLVENAVKHGIEPMAGGGAISVDVECVAPHLRISVTDTGVGLTGQTEASGGGMGLANTADRLRSLYGDAARLTVEAAPGGGVVASLIIPLGAPAQLESSVR